MDKKEHILFLHRSEWEPYLNVLNEEKQEEYKKNYSKAYRKYLKEGSAAIEEQFQDSAKRAVERKLKQREDHIEYLKLEASAHVKNLDALREEERKRIMDAAEKLLSLQEPGTTALNSAFMECTTRGYQQLQAAENKKKKDAAKVKYDLEVKAFHNDLEVYKKNEEEKSRKRKLESKEYLDCLQEQIATNTKRKNAEMLRKYNDDISDQQVRQKELQNMLQDEKNKKEELKKENSKVVVNVTQRMKEVNEEKKKYSLKEDELNNTIIENKKRIDNLIKKASQQGLNKRMQLTEKVSENFYKKQLEKESLRHAKESELTEKVAAEIVKQENESLEEAQRKKQEEMRQLNDKYLKYQEQKEIEKATQFEEQKWEMLNISKQLETAEEIEKRKKLQRKKAAVNKINELEEQIKKNNVPRQKKKQDNEDFDRKSYMVSQKKDHQFFDHAKEITEDLKNRKFPTRPVEMQIKKYKMENDLHEIQESKPAEHTFSEVQKPLTPALHQYYHYVYQKGDEIVEEKRGTSCCSSKYHK